MRKPYSNLDEHGRQSRLLWEGGAGIIRGVMVGFIPGQASRIALFLFVLICVAGSAYPGLPGAVSFGKTGNALPGSLAQLGTFRNSPGEQHRKMAQNPEISRIVSEIDERNIERTITTLVSFGTRNTLSAQEGPRGIGAARDWIYNEFQKIAATAGGRLSVERQSFAQEAGRRIPQPIQLTNIVATLRGVQPESTRRMYVVSGHYDSICSDPTDATCDAPGADDDGSGVATVLEAARVMSKREFKATIVFVAVAGEEQGLYGSTYYAEQAKRNGWDIEGMFTNDIVGSSTAENGTRDVSHIRVFSEGVPSNETPAQAAVRRGVGGENDSASRELARFIYDASQLYVPDLHVEMIYRRDRYLRGGDHIPFLERGYPAVRFCEPNEIFRHQHQNVRMVNGMQYGDLPQYVDFRYTAQVARLNAASLAMLALAPIAPRDAGIVAKELTNDTELRWTANPEPDTAGYEIVWRETNEPFWMHAIPAGNVTDYIVKEMSKDNYFFGIRAIDSQGNASPVSFPKPVK